MKYWQKRLIEQSENLYDTSTQYLDELYDLYFYTSRDINMRIQRLIDGMSDINYAEAIKSLNEEELKFVKEDLKDFREKSKGVITPEIDRELDIISRRVRISRLQAMEVEIKARTFELLTREEALLFSYLIKTYETKYTGLTSELSRFTGYKHIDSVNSNLIKAVIENPWAEDGKNFSKRIWDRRDKLVVSLNNELKTGIVTGKNPNDIIKSLSNKFNVSKSQAKRLVITENTAIQSRANFNAFKDMGVSEYEIFITLDNRTSDICRDLEGKIFKIKDYQVGVTAPPFHPNCRSVAVPFFDDDIQKEIEKDRMSRNERGKSVRVKDMSYKEWKKQVINN